MHPWQTRLARQLEDLHLVRCSLLPGEQFAFILPAEDIAIWTSLLDAFTDAGGIHVDQDHDGGVITSLADPPCQARFEVRVAGAKTWFEVALPCTSSDADADMASLAASVKGSHSREAHERWTAEIAAQVAETPTSAFPAYALLAQLVPALHQSPPSPSPSPPPLASPAALSAPDPPYHALLTSHHLVSPTKRRTMRALASTLDLAGFAKLGYPGLIYAEGPRNGVEAFVREVKAMQWLALRVRFVAPVPRPAPSDPGSGPESGGGGQTARWVEVSKIGEVLALMRTRGREDVVTDLGIGTSSKEPGC